MKHTKKTIQQMVGINDLAYYSEVFESGMLFLETYYHQDTNAVSHLSQLPEFWNWYKNVFEQIDELFVRLFSKSAAPQKMLLKLWKEQHSYQNTFDMYGSHVIEYNMGKLWSAAWVLKVVTADAELAHVLSDFKTVRA